MSYLRSSWPHQFVDGDSEDYIYSDGNSITDFGTVSKEGIVELLYREWKTDDVKFKEYLLRNLAKRLKVKLRKKPLTPEEAMDMMEEKIKQFEKTGGFK